MKKIFTLLFCVVGSILFLKAQSPEALMTQASTEYKSSNFVNAISLCSKIIQQKPDAYLAYCTRGLSYYQLGKYDASISDYNKAIEYNPNFAEVIYYRGLVYEIGRAHV